jgi:predicted RNase H-like HicB family nuclease
VKRASYTARSTRSGNWWAIQIDELDGVYSQARRLEQVEDMARDAIAATLDVAPGSFAVTVIPELPAKVQAILDDARASREAAERASELASVKAREAARILHEEGMPLRDVGRVLGVSHQRAHQLVRDGLGAVAEWEAEQGALTETEVAAARARVARELSATPSRSRRRPA